MEMSAKEKAKVRDLHDELMAIADRHEMSMEDLIDAAVEGEMPEMEGGEEMEEGAEMEEAPEQGQGPDRAKIALIIGKMRRGQE
jgi:hypothetical protein